MALTTSGFQGVITESQEANRFYRIAPPALADGPADMAVTGPGTGSTRQASIAAGTVQVCGVTTTTTGGAIAFPANSSGQARYDLLVLRHTWAGAASATTFIILPGTSSGPPTPTRNPGSVYEFPLAVVRVNANATTIGPADVYDIRTYAGRGGRLRVPQESYIGWADGHIGTELIVEGTTRTYRRAVGNVWTLVSDVITPWRYFDPIVRFKGQGQAGEGVASMGTGGVRRGRYKIIDGFLIGEVEVRTGTGGITFGAGAITIDLPPGYPPDTYFADRWQQGHMYTTAEAVMDWSVDALLKGGETRAAIYVTAKAGDARMVPAKAQDGSNTVGSGSPWIATGYSDPKVITLNLCYSVAG